MSFSRGIGSVHVGIDRACSTAFGGVIERFSAAFSAALSDPESATRFAATPPCYCALFYSCYCPHFLSCYLYLLAGRSNIKKAVRHAGARGVTETRSYTRAVVCRELKILDSGSIPGIADRLKRCSRRGEIRGIASGFCNAKLS